MPSNLIRSFAFSLPVLGLLSALACQSETTPAYRDTGLSFEERVDDLVSQMTLEEKVSQLNNDAPAIERLGVPRYNWWNECLHGVARAGRATVFPQAIGLAATWDAELLHRAATAISDEGRAKYHEFVGRGKRNIYQGITYWSPNINIFRDPRWGRGMETYGEDPFLSGSLGVQFVKGIQGDHPRYLKAVATPKHYAVHSGPEPERHTFDAQASERDLRETYLPHFQATIEEGGAFSVMCAYNRFEGEACCGSPRLLTEILRDEWGFEGYVVSDCGAIRDIFQNHKIVETSAEAAALAVQAGCDLNCGVQFLQLVEAVKQGLIAEEEIDRAVKRLFLARFKLGMFDPPEEVPYSEIAPEVVESEKHRELTLEAARKSIVLLKNSDNLLPLSRELRSIAVIGPNADDPEILLGNYNGEPSEIVTPLEGIRNKVGGGVEVLYSRGCPVAENLPAFEVVPSSVLSTEPGSQGERGLRAEYFASSDFSGKARLPRELTYPGSGEMSERTPVSGEPVFTRVDPQIDFNWWDGAPDERLDDDNFGVRWTGYLTPPVSGTYQLGALGFNAFEVYLEEELLVAGNNIHHPSYQYKQIELEAGRSYPLRVEFYETVNNASMQLVWDPPGGEWEEEALEAARKADLVTLFMGLSPRLEGEEMNVPVEGFRGGDRLSLDLPGVQQNLIRRIAGLGKPVVLVVLSGSALSINWEAENIPAILEAWYPGQEAGTALADVLFGDYNPAGRLPVTFYRSVDQLPPFEDYPMAGRTYRYFDGTPLFPFGHGLSYTRFSYHDLSVPVTVGPADESIQVSVRVENSGERAGEEVVQLYISDLEASVPVPIRSLKGFQRIALGAGEAREVEFTLSSEALSLIDANGQRVVEPGSFRVTVGGKQPGFSGLADAPTTETLSQEFEVSGN